MKLPYKGAYKSHVSQGYTTTHQAVDFAPYQGYGKWLCAPENVKITNIIDSLELSESLEPLKRGYGIAMQSIAYPTRYHIYWHCLPIFPVSVGDTIMAGGIVAQMGNSGECYRQGVLVPLEERTKTKAGTHLHWEYFDQGADNSRTYINFFNNIDWNAQPTCSILEQIGAITKIVKQMLAIKK